MPRITNKGALRSAHALAESEGSNKGAPRKSRVQSFGSLQGLPVRDANEICRSQRSTSAPRRLAADLNGKGILDETDKRLTALYGPTRPARAKEGRLAVQATEFEPEDSGKPEKERRARVNPTRVWMTKTAEAHGMAPVIRIASQATLDSPTRPPKGTIAASIDLAALRRGEVAYKWDVSNNGTLIVGESKPVDPETGKRTKMGHTTLVGGRVVPEARFGGVLRYDTTSQQLIIDNDSGRFSEHGDLTLDHLKNVVQLFNEAGLEVRPVWKNMVREAGGEAHG